MPFPKLHGGPSAVNFLLHLVVEDIKQLPLGTRDCSLVSQIEWRGSKRKDKLFARGNDKNCTSQQQVQADGTASWNEGFDHKCKLKRKTSESYQSWIVGLQIEEVQQRPRDKVQIIGKAMVDVAEYVNLENEESIRIPINCSIRGYTSEAILLVKLNLIKSPSKDRNRITLTRVFSLHPFFSGSRLNSSRKSNNMKLPNPQEDRLYATDLVILNGFAVKHDDGKKMIETYIRQPSTEGAMEQMQGFLIRQLPWNKAKAGMNRANQTNGPACAEGGDDVVDGRRHQSCIQLLTHLKQVKVQPEENFASLRLKGNRKIDVGLWERKKIVSRDGKIELATDVFFASFDQCSKKAAGGSACTVLAAVIADWLHKNPKNLPNRRQFDELVHRGSSEWRDLCVNENHSDKHFDLETVLEAKIMPLTLVTEKSYVGFFNMEEMPEGLDWMQGEMSFDSVWNNIICTDIYEEKIYIAGWNDHFFVLKVESDAIYLIDSLGERLFEGCNQAYILKFHAESAVYLHAKDKKGRSSSQHVVSEGIDCCKEYIKGFLSAIPLRDLQGDIKRGRGKQELLHRLLQIDFHYTAPCTMDT